MGQAAGGILEDRRRVRGVRVATPGAEEGEIPARLAVGADRHRFTVAELARVPADTAPNERFFFCAYYRGVVAGARVGARVARASPQWSSPFPRTTGSRWSASSR
jgi:hypothetical protein